MKNNEETVKQEDFFLTSLVEIIEEIGIKRVFGELIGIQAVIKAVGVESIIEAVGIKRIIDEVGINKLLNETWFLEYLIKLNELCPEKRETVLRGLTQNDKKELITGLQCLLFPSIVEEIGLAGIIEGLQFLSPERQQKVLEGLTRKHVKLLEKFLK